MPFYCRSSFEIHTNYNPRVVVFTSLYRLMHWNNKLIRFPSLLRRIYIVRLYFVNQQNELHIRFELVWFPNWYDVVYNWYNWKEKVCSSGAGILNKNCWCLLSPELVVVLKHRMYDSSLVLRIMERRYVGRFPSILTLKYSLKFLLWNLAWERNQIGEEVMTSHKVLWLFIRILVGLLFIQHRKRNRGFCWGHNICLCIWNCVWTW